MARLIYKKHSWGNFLYKNWFILTFGLVLCTSNKLNAQLDSIQFNINVLFDDTDLELDRSYYVPTIKDSITITRLKFYISDIRLYNNQQLTGEAKSKYHLIDLESPKAIAIAISNSKTWDRIEFNLGVDSLMNTTGAHGGDLDPMHGMYWSWNSGYINFKLEGQSKVCPTRKNKYNLHLGGFQKSHDTCIAISRKINILQNIEVDIAINELFDNFDLRTNHTIMNPSDKAVNMMLAISKLIRISE